MYSQANGFPEGFVVRTTSGGEGTIEINAGEGSLGVYTTGQSTQVKSGEEVKLNDPQSGGWYGEFFFWNVFLPFVRITLSWET